MSIDYEVLDLGLVYYKNVIKDPQFIIETVNDVDKRFRAQEHGGSHTDVKAWNAWTYGDMTFNWQKFFPESKNVSSNDYYSKEMKAIADMLYSSLDNAFDHYANVLYPFAGKNIKNREESIHLLRYEQNGHLPAHQDQGVSSRVLSSVMYLNDNYEGGEIVFQSSGVKLKPEAGSIIFFPSNFLYVHEVYPITSGSRYSMPHWYHNMKNMIHSNGDE
jgi:predicted 2-oxoglutarate/Fe(II)-dependent dioxygenase YbiX